MFKPYYQDELITLYCGDCLAVLPELQGKFDLCLTDPPYGVNYQNNMTEEKHDRLQGDQESFSYFNWGQLVFDLLNDATALFAYTGWSVYPQHYNDLQSVGFKLKEPLIVQKRASGKTDLNGSFQTNCDWLLFAHKGRFTFYQTEILKNKYVGVLPGWNRNPVPEFKYRFPSCWFGEQYPFSTAHPQVMKRWRHPTIKNSEFLKWLIQLSTEIDGVVIDPLCGSGSTLVAAKELKQRCVGIEIEEKYCAMAVERLAEVKV